MSNEDRADNSDFVDVDVNDTAASAARSMIPRNMTAYEVGILFFLLPTLVVEPEAAAACMLPIGAMFIINYYGG